MRRARRTQQLNEHWINQVLSIYLHSWIVSLTSDRSIELLERGLVTTSTVPSVSHHEDTILTSLAVA